MQPTHGTTGSPLAAPLLVCVRAGALGCLVTAFAAVAHVSAHGLLPPWPVVLLVLSAAAAVCAPLSQREISTRMLLVLTCVGQAALHAAFTLFAGHAGPATHAVASCAEGGGATAGFLTGPGGGPVRACASSLDAVTSLISPAELPMAVAHLLAAAALALLLARGEHALWSLLALLAALAAPVRRAARLLGLVLPSPTAAAFPLSIALVPAATTPAEAFASVAPRRGPPARS